MLLGTNTNRAMQTIMLERSDRQPIYHRVKGAFPMVKVVSEPEEEPEVI